LVADEQYGKKHDCFSGGVEMSITAVVEHFYFLEKVGPITRFLVTSPFDRILLTVHCRIIDMRRDIDSMLGERCRVVVAPEELCARSAAPAAPPIFGKYLKARRRRADLGHSGHLP
jgi:hypothetical protein